MEVRIKYRPITGLWNGMKLCYQRHIWLLRILILTVETGDIPQMPLFERSLRHLLRRSGHVERARRGEVLLGALVDDGAADAVVDAEGEVLAEGQDLDAVGLAVGDDLVAEHGAHGVVANVVAHLEKYIRDFGKG